MFGKGRLLLAFVCCFLAVAPVFGDRSWTVTGGGGGGSGSLDSANSATTTDVTVTNTTTETELYTFTIPGGTLGTNQCAEQWVSGILTTDGATSLTVRAKYGAGETSSGFTPAALSANNFAAMAKVCGDGTEGTQRVSLLFFYGNSAGLRQGQTDITVDSTAANALALTIQWGAATAAVTITKDTAITTATAGVTQNNPAACSAGQAITDWNPDGTVTCGTPVASALGANGTNASAGNAILGVDAAGNAEGAFDVATQAELDAGLAGKQAADTELTEIAALSCTNGQIAKRVTGAWQCAADDNSGGGGGGTPGGSNTQLQVNNAGAFGGISLFTYDAARDGQLQLVLSGGNTGLVIKEPGTTISAPNINGSPTLLTLSTSDASPYYALGYQSKLGGIEQEIANYQATGNTLWFDFYTNGVWTGNSGLLGDGGAWFSGNLTVDAETTAIVDFSAATTTKPFSSGAGAAPTAANTCAYDSTANRYKCGNGSSANTLAWLSEVGSGQTLQQAVTNGRTVTDAVDTGSQVCIGGSTNKTCFYGNTTRAYPDADTVIQPLATFDVVIKDAGGTARITVDGDTGVVTSNITGNATTATALATNPTDCSANQFANTIAASGNLTCAAIVDADVPDTLTASNYVPLAGATLTGQLVTDNLGIEFDESDTNPTCASGNYNVYADTSEGKLKKCTNGTVSDLDTTGGGSSAYKCGLIDCNAPVLGDFTGVNVAGASTDTTLANTVYLSSDLTSSASTSVNLWKKAVSGTYLIKACFIPQFAYHNNRVGIGFRQSSDGKLETIDLGKYSSTTELRVNRHDTPTTAASNLVWWNAGEGYVSSVCFSIEDNGTNRILGVSKDGVTYRTMATYTRTTYLTADEVFFFVASGTDWAKSEARLMHWAQ